MIAPSSSLPPNPAPAVFWTTDDVLLMARATINDMQIDQSGDLLSTDQPYTWVLLNKAYALLIDRLADEEVEECISKEALVTGIPISPATDPEQRVSLGRNGYFDGVNLTQSQWQMPGDLLMPKTIYERPSGSNARFLEIKQVVGGITALGGFTYFRQWEYRENRIWFPYATGPIDLRIRYMPSMPQLIQASGPATIPVPRMGTLLADALVVEFAASRGSPMVAWAQARVDQQITLMSNRSAKRTQGVQFRKRRYGRGKWRRR